MYTTQTTTTTTTSRHQVKRQHRREVLPKQNDEDLMAQFQAGTLDAFDILVERYTPRLTRFAYRFVRDMDRCQDLVQETFIRVYRNRYSYRPIARFSTWIYTITRNLARSEYRVRNRVNTVPLYGEQDDGSTFEIALPDASAVPEKEISIELRRNLFDQAVETLPDAYRELITLREVQGMTYQEMADVTELPIGTVKSRLHRARLRLKAMVQKADEPRIPETA
jgi:RNA polymerase sigma-70 factor (ECF subfamily)